MEEFERTLYNCSKSANYTVPFVDELDMEYNYDDAVVRQHGVYTILQLTSSLN